jgi:hypothetical protein
MDDDNLGNRKADLIASAAKSVVGTVPIAGSFLSEVVSNIIPNQRIDRLTKYARELDAKISKIPVDKVNALLANENLTDLIEESYIQASRATTDDRRQYIASIVSKGMTQESIDLQESKHLLKLLQELNDIEIIWLRFYLDATIGGDKEFRDKHKDILTPITAYIGSSREVLNKSALQQSYKEHLERLELINSRIRFDSRTGVPEFDTFTGRPKTSSTKATTLGKLLLSQIGLFSD